MGRRRPAATNNADAGRNQMLNQPTNITPPGGRTIKVLLLYDASRLERAFVDPIFYRSVLDIVLQYLTVRSAFLSSRP